MRPDPALALTLDTTPDAALALATSLPAKSAEKPVDPIESNAPELPNALTWHARPRYDEQTALALVLGDVKIWPPVVPGSMGWTTFWKTLPSATMLAPEPSSKACPLFAYQ